MISRNFDISVFNIFAQLSKKRFSLRVAANGFTYFALLSRTQRLVGVTSRCFDENGKPDGTHIIMWDLDLEKCTLEEAKKVLIEVQKKYDLSYIYLASDSKGSYRAWCFNKINEKTLYHVLVDSLDIIDYGFFYYTVKRSAATLRTGSKEGRPLQSCVAVLRSYFVPFPKGVVEQVIYETGVEKKGTSLMLGVDG